ncbi:hypothetical protein F3Y22_tig00110419pilonHSYRG00021 [Hibiscus syriacus]|uniref:RNase H type-1 domain-containing protein n=1 Tax=Hibiscus syriacus TaxID=106335 RepID=A0A6A3ALW5_HIBSY|nr:hypothetical protein F3Y22_tig00110419pilonHSYRG00021 [Hibiscus syriacus]
MSKNNTVRIIRRTRQSIPCVTAHCWIRPPFGWVKTNSDGACHRELGTASCGGVIRSHEGRWLLDFAKFIGIYSVLEAELCGMYQCLCCAKDGGFTQVIVEVDSLEALKEVSDSKLNSSRLSVVHHIAKLLERE